MTNPTEEPFDIIIFALHSWTKCEVEGFRTRDAHFLQEFERSSFTGKILVVDRPVSLPEMLWKKRSLRPSTGKLQYKGNGVSLTKVSEKISVLDFFSCDVIGPVFSLYRWWSKQLLKKDNIDAVLSAQNHLGMQNPVLFISTPFCTEVIGKLNEKLVIFDAIDNLLKHHYMLKEHSNLEKRYEFIKKQCDIIFTNSEPLATYLREGRDNVCCVRNGVEPKRFAQENLEIPFDLKGIKQPLVGYSGKINQRLNKEILEYTIENLPEISFVFIGQMMDREWFKSLFKFKNVHYLGDKHYDELPSYLAAFDIGIVPHVIGKEEHDPDAMKTYEYLAAGKPVVATNIIGIKDFGASVTVGNTREEFKKGIQNFLKNDKEERQKMSGEIRKSIKPGWTWESRVKTVLSTIHEKLNTLPK